MKFHANKSCGASAGSCRQPEEEIWKV